MTPQLDKIRANAAKFAEYWLVNAIDRVVASLKDSDDIPTVLEQAFTDGYMTGYTHAQAEARAILSGEG